MDDTEVWAAVDRGRSAIAELLAGLEPAGWETPSLCEGWRVRDVAAHLTMPLLGLGQLALLAVRHPGSTNRLIRDGSIDLARRYDTDEIVGRLRRLVGHHRPMPGLTCREALVDVVGHTLDMTVPLGRDAGIPAADSAEAAHRVVALLGTRTAKVFRPVPVQGYRLVATDHDWATGNGPQVEGTVADLFLLLTGRTARLEALGGAGAPGLRRAVAV